MIRIDEIYNNIFWPWVKKNIPGTRVFYCDPPGRSDVSALFNHGQDDWPENKYIFMHDQEPIHFDLHGNLFDEVVARNLDMLDQQWLNVGKYNWDGNQHRYMDLNCYYEKDQNHHNFFRENKDFFHKFIESNPKHFGQGQVVVSELGEYAEELQKRYNWKINYYFYHGWACQDWFRGYDKSFLIPRARDRQPTKTFLSPNRIIAGKRDHRVLFLYNIFKNDLSHNWLSAPRVCSYENVDISVVARKYKDVYPDIEQTFDSVHLPIFFPGEDHHIMSSCWLTNFDESADSLMYVPTETVYFGRRLHITEKTFKAIALEMPFILVAPAGSLEYLRRYGFRSFHDIIDESYDQETDDIRRIEKVVKLLKDLDGLSVAERRQIHRALLPAVEHNYHHFYNGGLSDVLWTELLDMLNGLQV